MGLREKTAKTCRKAAFAWYVTKGQDMRCVLFISHKGKFSIENKRNTIQAKRSAGNAFRELDKTSGIPDLSEEGLGINRCITLWKKRIAGKIMEIPMGFFDDEHEAK